MLVLHLPAVKPSFLATLRVLVLLALAAAGALLALRPALALPGAAMAFAAAASLAWLAWRLADRQAQQQAGAEALQRQAGELQRRNDRLEAEISLRTADVRDSHARLRSVIDSAVDGIIVIDDRGLIESFNPGAERLFGYTEAEVLGRNVHVLMPSPYREEHDGYLSRYIDTGRAKIIGTGREVTGLRRDGTTFPLHLSVGEMVIGGDRKFTGIVHDLTTRVQMEEQLRERAALAKLGEMAAVIAHEVKNPLAGVRGAIQVVGRRLPPGSGDAPIVEEILSRLDALNRLIDDLLIFARPSHPRLGPVELGPLLRTTAELICRDPHLAGVSVEVAGAAPPIRADSEMLKIVFQNLLVNAAQAMHRAGTIHVSIDAAPGTARVSVRDAGPGIPPEIREKVFTAFFTTKSRGSGLGLATARRLVEAHHGEIAVECPPGGGTTVSVHLPAHSP